MRKSTLWTLSLGLGALLAVTAHGQRFELQTERSGGPVTFEGRTFPSMEAFHRSEEFREHGLRCGSPEPHELDTFWFRSTGDCTMTSTTIRSQYNPGDVLEIPVVFHVIRRTDGTGDLNSSFIHSQIEILNEDFRSLAGTPGGAGYDTRIQFALATVDPSGNPTSGIRYVTNNTYFQDPGPGAYNAMKNALRWDPSRYLNLYSNDGAGYLGYATFPQQSAGNYDDGVVLLWSSVGRNNPNGGIYNQGRTATHEVGHYLGLFHTFQGGCGIASSPYTTGDLIADTERQQSPNYNCPTSASSCSSPDPIRNYMNYTQDTCMREVTPEQANRARCALLNYRGSLYRVAGGDQVLHNGVAVTNLSGAQGSEQRWTFEVPSGAKDLRLEISGGSGDADLYVKHGSPPTLSSYDCRPYRNGNNEVCTFPSPSAGTWHVMLRGYTSYSGVTLVGSYSTNQPPTANFSFTTSGLTVSFTDTSTDPDGFIAARSWSFGDGTTSTATNPSKTYSAGGTYSVRLTVTDNDGATASVTKSVSVTAPPSCDGTLYSGSLSSGQSQYQPNGTYYYSGSGNHQGTLKGPSSGADFDLYLHKWINSSWQVVASATTASSDESISYNGTTGYYVWRVYAYSGSGSYTLCIKTP